MREMNFYGSEIKIEKIDKVNNKKSGFSYLCRLF